jgi:hypothetical protein
MVTRANTQPAAYPVNAKGQDLVFTHYAPKGDSRKSTIKVSEEIDGGSR